MAYGPPEPPQPAVPATPENTPWAIAINQAVQQGLLTPANIQAAIDNPVMQLIAQDQALKQQQAQEQQAQLIAQQQAEQQAQQQASAPKSTAFVPEVANDPSQEFNTTYNTIQKGGVRVVNGQVVDASGNVLPANPVSIGNNQYDLQIGSAGGVIHTVVNTNPTTGQVSPITDYNKQVSYTGGVPGGGLLKDVVAIGLAYALPIIGEAIAAELAVSASVGTALAAVGTGVAQGQTIEQAIKNAAPSLIASGIMNQVQIGDFTKSITDSKQLQNVIANVASSTVKTAIAGGTAEDIFKNALSTGGGTLLGQTLDSQTIGQGLATTLATGNLVKGATAAAGSAGSQQASINAADRPIAAERADIDALLNQKASIKYDDGLSLLSQDPNTKQVILPLLAAPALITSLESAGILLADIAAHTGIIAYLLSLTQSGIQKTPEQVVIDIKLIKDFTDANATAQQANQAIQMVDGKLKPVDENLIKETKDKVVTDLGEIVVLGKKLPQIDVTTSSVSGGGSSSPTGGQPPGGVPEPGSPTSPTSPPTELSKDQKILNLINQAPSGGPASATGFSPGTVPKGTGGPSGVTGPRVPPAPVNPPGSPGSPGVPGPVLPPGPVMPPGQLTNAPPGPETPPGPQQPSSLPGAPGQLGDGTSPGSGGADSGTGLGGKGKGTGTGDGTGTGLGTGIDGTGTGKGTGTGAGTGPGTGVGPGGTGEGTGELPSISVGTSYVKPKTTPIKASYPTIQGQFASPLTQAVSSYRPPGEIESMGTGKEREDVWNVESLRNALGI